MRRITIALCTVVWVGACGEGDTPESLGQPDPARSSVSAAKEEATAGLEPVAVEIALRDSDGRPLPGIAVALSVEGEGAYTTGSNPITGEDGSAVGEFVSTRVGKKTVRVAVVDMDGEGLEIGYATVLFTAGKVASLAIAVPSSAVAGVPLDPPVSVTLRDAHDNTVESASAEVTLGLVNPPAGALLAGVTSAVPSAGVARFPTVSVAKVGSGYRLRAQAAGIVTESTDAFTIVAGPPSGLAFDPFSGDVIPGAALDPPVTVRIVDKHGNPTVASGGTVTVGLGEAPAGATLVGTTKSAVEEGSAAFPGLIFEVPGAGYTLVASSTGLATGESLPFTVLPKLLVEGTATFERIPTSAGQGYLAANATIEPIRQAVVQVVGADSGTVLAESTTDAVGFFTLSFSGESSVFVRVRAETLVPAIRVEDNTADDLVYAIEGAPFDVAEDTYHDLHAEAGWSGGRFKGKRLAAPFAILDSALRAGQAAAAVGAETGLLVINWSPLNTTSLWGEKSDGFIGSSHFEFETGEIYILGDQFTDADEFDDHVVVHEWGHFLQHSLGRSDGIGGSHGWGDVLDPRVAYSEGLATALSAIVLYPDTVYVDTLGLGEAGFGYDLEAGNAGVSKPGWFSEHSVQSVLYDLVDDSPDEPHDEIALGMAGLYDVLTEIADTPALATVFPFAHAAKLSNPTAAGAIDAVLLHHAIAPVADAWGSAQVEDGGWNANLPIYKSVVVGGAVGLKLISGGHWNGLSANRYVRFQGNGELLGIHGEGCVADTALWLFHRGELLNPASLWADVGTNVDSVAGEEYVAVIQDFSESSNTHYCTVTLKDFGAPKPGAPVSITGCNDGDRVRLWVRLHSPARGLTVHARGLDGAVIVGARAHPQAVDRPVHGRPADFRGVWARIEARVVELELEVHDSGDAGRLAVWVSGEFDRRHLARAASIPLLAACSACPGEISPGPSPGGEARARCSPVRLGGASDLACAAP